MPSLRPLERAAAFCERYDLSLPILQAPMAGACPPELAAAVSNAGGMGGAGVLSDDPAAIAAWVEGFSARSNGPFQLNLWVPGPHVADPDPGDAASRFLAHLGGGDPPDTTRAAPAPSYEAQLEAMLAQRPAVVSSIMGLFEAGVVERIHAQGAAWFACATTLDEARAAEDAGADAIVVQGAEAGGHRGRFDPGPEPLVDVGLFALLPYLADRTRVPIVAAGGVGDGRGLAAALLLGASAVQVGTTLLRTPEAGIDPGWAHELDGLAPEATRATRAYSGRWGRAIATAFVEAWDAPEAPPPAAYPTQRRLVSAARRDPNASIDRVNHWAGQGAALARSLPAATVVTTMWSDARALLGDG